MWSTLGLRYAFSRLARTKVVFGLVVTSLGLTLGAVVCALAFTHLMISQPLPYPQQERLVVAVQVIIDHAENAHARAFSYPSIALLHDQSRDVFERSVMLDHARDVVVSHPAQPLVNVSYTAGDYAGLFAPPMVKGRFPDPAESMDGTRPVAVISHFAWQSLFGMREDVLGMSVRTASGMYFEVIGVTARDFVEPEFHGPGRRTALWLPWAFNPSPPHWGWTATTDTLTLVGRLSAGNEPAAAERLSELLRTRWLEEFGAAANSPVGWSTRVEVTSARRAIAGSGLEVGPLLLAGTLGLVVLGLVNLSHLLVARVAERAREFSIQSALGASRLQLLGQVFADMLLLMVPAGLLALAVAAAGVRAMRHYLAPMLARLDELSIGSWTIAMTISSTVVLAVLLAAIALASAWRPGPNGALNCGRQVTATKTSRRLRFVLMAGQIGVAGLLITVSIGLLRDANRMLNEEGIELARTNSAHLYHTATAGADEPIEQQFGELRRRLADLPGVEMVSQSHSPLQDFIDAALVSGRTGAQYPVGLKRIDHNYLGITGQALALGRTFTPAEIQQSASFALVNAAFARMLERDGGVLGTPLARGGGDPHTVIGVVNDLAYPGVSRDRPRIYLPAAEAGRNFIISFHPGQQMSREQLVSFLASVNPGLGLFLYDDLEQQRSDILLPRRISAAATLLIALVVILVSAIGLYGMVRYTTGLIRSEIGARLAFGARSGHIVLMLVTNNLTAVSAGCVAGGAVVVLLVAGVNRWIAHALDVHWLDGAMALGAMVLLAVFACYLSARPLLARSPASILSEAGS